MPRLFVPCRRMASVLNLLSQLYGLVATQRRRWYARHWERRRRLVQPVFSVGAITIGGSGKTPVAGYVANLLVSMGERPAILSRGYHRQESVDGVVVVRDQNGIRSDVARSGDESFMLARTLPDTLVLVSEDRYLAGRLAETRLGATVHVLDDGFQHLELYRDIDLVVLGAIDTVDPQLLPVGRLREPLHTVTEADALIVETSSEEDAREVATSLGVGAVFRLTRRLLPPRDPETNDELTIPVGTRVLAVTGIARPESFTNALSSYGYTIVDSMTYRDHYLFTRADLGEISRRLQSQRAEYVVTTEKDMVRLFPHGPFAFPIAWVPLLVSVEPADLFRAWMGEQLKQARA